MIRGAGTGGGNGRLTRRLAWLLGGWDRGTVGLWTVGGLASTVDLNLDLGVESRVFLIPAPLS